MTNHSKGFIGIGGMLVIGVLMLGALGFAVSKQYLDNVGSGGRQINTGGSLTSADIDTCSELGTILTGQTTGTCGSVVLSVSPTFTGLATFANASSTLVSSEYASSTSAFFGALTLPSLAGSGNNFVFVNNSGVAASIPIPLTVSNGGTNATTLTGLLQGNGTSAITGVTGTTGQFPYYNGTNTLIATSTLFIAADGKLGVASSTPQRALSVVGAVAIQEETLVDSATVVWNLATSTYARVNLTASRTLDITNAEQAIGQSVRLVVCANGAWSFTWDSLILWPGGTAPTQTATANKCDVYSGFVTNASSTPKIFLGSVLNF